MIITKTTTTQYNSDNKERRAEKIDNNICDNIVCCLILHSFVNS